MKRLKHSGKHRACDRWNGDSGSGTSQETEHTRYLGDDTGYHNISAYNLGIMAITHPTSIALRRKVLCSPTAYAQQSCTAGRAAFILGQHPFRTDLLTVGFPGSPHGIRDWTPTLGDLLKEQGYTTGQFGNIDRDSLVPVRSRAEPVFGKYRHAVLWRCGCALFPELRSNGHLLVPAFPEPASDRSRQSPIR